MKSKEKELTRRAFFEKAISTGTASLAAAGLCVCMLSACSKQDRTPRVATKHLEIKANRVIVDVDKVASLSKVGSAAKIVHAKLKDRIIVIRTALNRFLALSSKCTHKGRPLEYRPKQRQLRCINEGHAEFALDGRPLRGPAKKSLQVYKTLYLGGKLEVFL